jgi:hypothetical protein
VTCCFRKDCSVPISVSALSAVGNFSTVAVAMMPSQVNRLAMTRPVAAPAAVRYPVAPAALGSSSSSLLACPRDDCPSRRRAPTVTTLRGGALQVVLPDGP